MTMTTTTKETKAQRVERLKRSKNPWEGLDEIRRFAREGFGSIPPDWIACRKFTPAEVFLGARTFQ